MYYEKQIQLFILSLNFNYLFKIKMKYLEYGYNLIINVMLENIL